jgi:hypothetical protein
MCHITRPFHSSRFYHPNNIGWGVQITKLLLVLNKRPARFLGLSIRYITPSQMKAADQLPALLLRNEEVQDPKPKAACPVWCSSYSYWAPSNNIVTAPEIRPRSFLPILSYSVFIDHPNIWCYTSIVSYSERR